MTGVTQRHLVLKLLQRLALVYLKPRLATWRYRRGQRTLNLTQYNQTKLQPTTELVTKKSQLEEVEEELEVNETVESIIGSLLQALGDKDSVIRWSAAKGIGRISERLSASHAEDIVEQILQVMSLNPSETMLHGSCLCFAEMARRGLLPQHQLDQIVSKVLECLVFDEKKGTISVGANVRDAAAYVCWAFSRLIL